MPRGVSISAVVVALLVLLTVDGRVQAQTATPERCVEDQRSYNIAADETTSGTVSLRSGVGCPAGSVASLAIVDQPKSPSLVAPIMGWTYLFRPRSEETVQTTRGFTVNAMCGTTVMCQANILYTIAPVEQTAAPPSSSASAPVETTAAPEESTTEAPPVTYPACTASPYTVTYRPGMTYSDSFPMDATEEGCQYSVRLTSQPAVGLIAVMNPPSLLKYVFSAKADTPDTNVTAGYNVLCTRGSTLSVACEGTLHINVYEDIQPCPNKEAVFYATPGATLEGHLDLGVKCADPTAEFVATLHNWEGPGKLTCGENDALQFSFDAPNEEAFSSAVVRGYCDGAPLCETKLAILTTAKAPPTTSPAPTTTPPPIPKPECNRTFSYNVAIGEAIRGTLYYPIDDRCAVTTYMVPRAVTAPAGTLDVNLVGDFYYRAPATQGIDAVNVDVYCVTDFVCRTQVFFTSYYPLPNETTTEAPESTVSPLPACANVYYYTTAPGIPLSSSLDGKPGQDACAFGRYFTLSVPPQGGSLEFMISGDFLYSPTRQEGTDEFAFTQHCLGKPYCRGTAYFIVSDRWTLEPSSTEPPTSRPPVIITNPQIQCRGTCVEKAWMTYPNPPRWDISPGSGNVRKDGHPVDGIEVTWGRGSLIFTVYAMIGNLGARFPTFEPLISARGRYFESADFRGNISATSPGFELSCLDHQGRLGMGEDVWRWTEIGYGTGKGTVGAYYDFGESWYQKFGGKHVGCDTFANSCQFAPLLTPANATAGGGVWSIDVDDCDATWTGVFPYATLSHLTKGNGEQVWEFVADRSLKGTLISEAVRAHSWINPGQFDHLYTGHDIIINLNQFVNVAKLGETPISIDSEFYTYTDENGDEAFGLNMLVHPFVSANMTSSYAPDRHVKGFKWLRQNWEAPDSEQCPTCTGAKMQCVAEGQYSASTYTGNFPTGDCPAGVPRVVLSKGPSMPPAQCPESPMFIYDRPGFSASRNCRTTYQNITLRGVVPGSAALTVAQKRAFNFEGNMTLELLMDDDTRKTIDVTLSMYVSRLSQDSETAEGGLLACRSGSYWPILDPLGTSLPDSPFELAVATPSALCADDLSSSYGPSDWALFTLDLPHTEASQVNVRDIFVNYDGKRVYLLHKNPATGTAEVPAASTGAWWQYTQPFLAFRDLSGRAANGTLTYTSAMSGASAGTHNAYAFAFVPGAIGIAANVEVVVDAVITRPSGISTTTFRKMLHVDPLLTQLSRQGPIVIPTKDTKDNSKSDLYAIGATVGVAAAVVVTAVFFMIADNDRPLPKWVPRGKLIKNTVLSVLPTKKQSKKKEKRVVHKDMYDAMNSGKY